MRSFTETDTQAWQAMVGQKVWKNRSTDSKLEPKPFKSGLKVNTVKAVVKHDHTPNLAFTFEEDGSQVECWRCSLAPENRYGGPVSGRGTWTRLEAEAAELLKGV